MNRIEYDEFGFFHENAQEFGLPFDAPPAVRRISVEVSSNRRLSALVWQDSDPELVLLHGGAQNAHTWDTVAMALGRPLVALDLPGHGHSDGPGETPGVEGLAEDAATAIYALAPHAGAVVGMSLGGLTAIALAQAAPQLVRKIVLVDILPGIKGQRSQHITDFVSGPPTFASFDELLERTARFNPTRSVSSLRRGILHNAEQLDDGTWRWRWARHLSPTSARRTDDPPDAHFAGLWEALSSISVPLLLARGMRPDSVLTDRDEAELRRRQPSARIVHLDGGGHSLQGDTPVELAAFIEEFVFAH